MKSLPLVLLAACLFASACTHNRPASRRYVPSGTAQLPSEQQEPAPSKTYSPPTMTTPARPAAVPMTATPAPAHWPVRRAPAFTPATLPKRLTLSADEISQIREDIRRWTDNPLVPSGNEFRLYSSGVATLDHWLHHAPLPRHTPPNTPTYYEEVYRDGYQTELYRHEATGRRMSQRVFYSENMIPVCSIHYGRDGQPARLAHLTYEPSGLIRQVVVLDVSGKPAHGVCLAHDGVYTRTESVNYNLASGGKRSTHTLYEDDRIYIIAPDGSRKQVNRGAKLWWLTKLSSFGVKPLYPLPADFIVPTFDRFGSPQPSSPPDA